MHYMFMRLMKAIPAPIRSAIKASSLGKQLSHFLSKHTAELIFQTEWASEFKDNRHKVLDYWKRFRYLDEINMICKIKENTKVLDVGCGISTVLHFIPGERYGIDPLADEYKKLYSYPDGITIGKSSGEEIHFPTNRFDVVFCSNVLDHVTDPQKTIREIHRVLKPGGYFVLTLEIFEEKTGRDSAHPHCFAKKDVYTLLEGRFKALFEKESPWIGLKKYVNGIMKSHNKELILISEKT